MDQIASENSYLENYIDHVTIGTEAKDAAALQTMWVINQTAASGGLGAASRYNLMMHDPTILQLILQNIEAVQTTKCTIKNYAVSARIVNAGTAPITLWEYRCRARNDYQTDLQPTLEGGFSDAGTGIGAKPTSVVLGATPFQNPAWCSQFKITKVKRWNLRPAGVKYIKYKQKKNYQVTMERISPDANLKSILRGKSVSVFVVQGTFGYLATNTAGKRYGIVPPNVGIEYQTKVHYSWLKDESVAHGYNQYQTGLTEEAAQVPAPIVINHPDSAVGIGAEAAGTRINASTNLAAVIQVPFNIN